MTLEMNAIVELMGHSRIAGKISEHVMGGNVLLRVDVPATATRLGFTKFYSPAAIYCITPVDENTMLAAVNSFAVAPINPYILQHPALTDKAIGYDEESDDYDSDVF